MPHQRFFLELSYNGNAYHGWQVQPNAITVQAVLDKAMTIIFRQPIETLGCGRTDTGVHAYQFFAHFDLNEVESIRLKAESLTVVNSLNAILPKDIAVKRFIETTNQAHARFDAISRSYEYQIYFEKDPFKTGFAWFLRDRPDFEAMNKATKYLLGEQDFSCFSKSNTQTFTNNCIITRAEWVEKNNGMVFHISANRFLRNMVRAIVGTLIDIGQHKILPEAIKTILESKNRGYAGASVPACGLYLAKISYPYINENQSQ